MTMNDALVAALLDIERHVTAAGWEQPARLFALVPTGELLAAEPGLAEQFEQLKHAPADAFTAIEQEEFRSGTDLLDDLAAIQWPDTVAGCAISVERVFVPTDVENELPDDPAAAADFVNSHPRRQDLRVIAGVLRDGSHHGVARIKEHPEELLGGEDLAPGLVQALSHTLLS